ncbi:MAG: hypothetical protein ACYTEQ_18120 [Planctomycetota bacterium]|jgi:hypothetical protein
MTEELESAQEQTEETQSPAVPSAVSGDKPTSAPSVNVEEIVDALMPKLEEQIERRVQSTKDRRFATMGDDIERLKSYIKGAGGDVDRAVREMKLDDLIEQGGSPAQVQGGTGASGAEAAFEVISTELLSGAGIAFNDAEYNAFVEQNSGKVRDPAHWREMVKAHIDRRQSKATKQESVTDAAAASTSGATIAPQDVNEEMSATSKKLFEYYSGQHGSPDDPQNVEEIRKLEARLNEIEPKVNLDDPNVSIDLGTSEPWNI